MFSVGSLVADVRSEICDLRLRFVVLGIDEGHSALEVVKISNQRGIDISIISTDGLDQLIELAIVAVKRVFKENEVRFLPKLAEPAFAVGELISYHALPAKGGGMLSSFFRGNIAIRKPRGS